MTLRPTPDTLATLAHECAHAVVASAYAPQGTRVLLSDDMQLCRPALDHRETEIISAVCAMTVTHIAAVHAECFDVAVPAAHRAAFAAAAAGHVRQMRMEVIALPPEGYVFAEQTIGAVTDTDLILRAAREEGPDREHYNAARSLGESVAIVLAFWADSFLVPLLRDIDNTRDKLVEVSGEFIFARAFVRSLINGGGAPLAEELARLRSTPITFTCTEARLF